MTMTRSDKAEPFFCGRCKTDKKAKITVTREKEDGTTDVICNGCYGNILAGGAP